MKRSDLEWKLYDRENLTDAEIRRVEAALAGDIDAWEAEARELAQLRAEMADEYLSESFVHSSPSDYR